MSRRFETEANDRAVSPVVGTVLMVVLTTLLASMVTAGAVGLSDGLEPPSFERGDDGGDRSTFDYNRSFLEASPNGTGTSNHTVVFELDENTTLDDVDFEADYGDESRFTTDNVTEADVTVGVDEDGDRTIDRDLLAEKDPDETDWLDAEDDEVDIEFDLEEEVDLLTGQWLVISYDDVENRQAGTFDDIEIEFDGAVDDEATVVVEE